LRAPFGVKFEPFYFSLLTAELTRLLRDAGINVVCCYIDDLCVVGPDEATVNAAMEELHSVFSSMGIELSVGKTQWAAQTVKILGVNICTTDGAVTISVPPEKVYSMGVHLHLLVGALELAATHRLPHCYWPADWVQSLTGKLSWTAGWSGTARDHLRAFYFAINNEVEGCVDLRRARDLPRALAWWCSQSPWAPVPSLPRDPAVLKSGIPQWRAHGTAMASDASGEAGFGCIAGRTAVWGLFGSQLLR
jgi:hypothetical protein